MKPRVKPQNGEAGSVLVEFALSMTVILSLLLGTVDVGRALFAYDWVSNAARMATRFAMVRGSECSGLSGGCPALSADLTAYVDSLALGIDTSQITVTMWCYTTGNSQLAPPCDPSDSVQVQVQYMFTFLTPLSPHSWTMSSTSRRTVQK